MSVRTLNKTTCTVYLTTYAAEDGFVRKGPLLAIFAEQLIEQIHRKTSQVELNKEDKSDS